MANNHIFKRKIYDQMLEWKQSLSNKKKALIIRGARQIGKTTIVEKFGQDNYKNVIYINFMKERTLKEAFAGSLDVDNIIAEISIRKSNINFIPHETLIIFDEIQECANARSSLKFFCEDGRYDVIGTGSLLGISGYSKKDDASIPVGFEHFLTMTSMDFEEFLWAIGKSEQVIDGIKNSFFTLKPISPSTHEEMNKLFKNYICVGGMPEAISEFINTSDFNKVRIVQNDIIESYRSDFGKHLDKNEKSYINNSELNKINQIFDSIPYQLAKEYKRFKFKEVKSGASFRDYEASIQWLCQANIISLNYNVNSAQFPLEGFKIDNSFKIYMNDTGLLISTMHKDVAAFIYTNQIGMYKGYIYENIVADAFIKNKIPLIHYSDKYEIDFLTQFKTKIVPIEVKAKDGNTKSLKELIKTNKSEILFSIKIKDANIGFVDNVLTIPHYLTFMINDDNIDKLLQTLKI